MMRKASVKLALGPVLFFLLPQIYLFQHNMQEVSISQLFLPVFAALTAAVFLYLLLAHLTGKPVLSSIAVCLISPAVYYYGLIYDFFDDTSIHGLYSSQILWIIVYIIICIVGFRMIFKLRNEIFILRLAWFFQVFACVLLVMNLLLMGAHSLIRESDEKSKVTLKKQVETKTLSSLLPDIYYIILDEYASSHTIRKYYNYNNSSFEENLKSKGFFLSESSTSRYDVTEFAIASRLNMTEIDTKKGSQFAYSLIGDDKVSAKLTALGYSYIHIGMSMEVNHIQITRASKYYNYFSAKHFYMENDYLSKLIDMSLLRPLLYTANWTKIQQDSVNYSFEKLMNSDAGEYPRYVFAHVMCPHHPFVFDSEGGSLSIRDRKNWKDKSIYLGQYIYVTRKIEEWVDKLLKTAEAEGRKPIVIIQSDHGPRKIPGEVGNERFRIFNAMLLPDGGVRAVYEGISPVNTFPAVFNYYFHEQIGFVDDK